MGGGSVYKSLFFNFVDRVPPVEVTGNTPLDFGEVCNGYLVSARLHDYFAKRIAGRETIVVVLLSGVSSQDEKAITIMRNCRRVRDAA